MPFREDFALIFLPMKPTNKIGQVHRKPQSKVNLPSDCSSSIILSRLSAMASQKSLDALEAMHRALSDMQQHLEPLLDLLQNDEATHHQRALVQAGIALTLGTLRFVAPKLIIPSSNSKKKGGPSSSASSTAQLRTDLNHMRKLLVTLQKKNGDSDKSKSEKSGTNNDKKVRTEKSTENLAEGSSPADAAVAQNVTAAEGGRSPSGAAAAAAAAAAEKGRKRKESPTTTGSSSSSKKGKRRRR